MIFRETPSCFGSARPIRCVTRIRLYPLKNPDQTLYQHPSPLLRVSEKEREMGWSQKVIDVFAKASNNNTVVNTVLIASFAALCLRSMKQQNAIEALEAEKDSLLKTNKAIRKSMWDWKQQLFSEAESNPSYPVPLSRLKIIYGEAPSTISQGEVHSYANVTCYFLACLIFIWWYFVVFFKSL